MVHNKTSTLHFKNVGAYHNYLKYIYGTKTVKHHKHPVVIAGKVHEVCRDCGSLHHKTHEHSMHHPVHHSSTGQHHSSSHHSGSILDPVITKKNLSNPNKVYSRSNLYGGKNNLYQKVLTKGVGIKIPKIKI